MLETTGTTAEAEHLRHLAEFLTPRASVKERLAAGKALRKSVPRSAHALWSAPENRPDPLAILEAQNAGRIASLVPLRMGRMASSAFAFLRGGAAIMAADLAPLPRTGLEVMACGDMHLSNFGVFASAERNLIFAINDFDEVHPGPWEWDLKRLAASATVAVGFMGGDRHQGREAAEAVTRSYSHHMHRYARMGALEIWYDQIDEATILAATPPEYAARTKKIITRAHARGHQRSLERLTEKVDGEHRLIEDHPIIVRETHLTDGTPVPVALEALLRDYIFSLSPDRVTLLRRYRIRDVVRKVVGVGSVGTGCWVILLQGTDADDPLFLQIKEAGPSVLAPYATTAFDFDNDGLRVVTGQRMIQGSPDIFLGWGHSPGVARDYYVRQLADMKGSFDLVENDRRGIGHLMAYCRLCGWALALAHAKSGDAAMIAGYCGRGDALPEAIGAFAGSYARQNQADYGRLMDAIRAGGLRTTLKL